MNIYFISSDKPNENTVKTFSLKWNQQNQMYVWIALAFTRGKLLKSEQGILHLPFQIKIPWLSRVFFMEYCKIHAIYHIPTSS